MAERESKVKKITMTKHKSWEEELGRRRRRKRENEENPSSSSSSSSSFSYRAGEESRQELLEDIAFDTKWTENF